MNQISDVMSRNVQVISPDANLVDAARCMRDGGFGMMPVGRDGRMIGAISDRDIAVRAVAQGRDPKTTPVREVMSEGICWVYEDEPVERAAEIMGSQQVRRVPVVNRDKRLVGIVALGDLAVREQRRQPSTDALGEISLTRVTGPRRPKRLAPHAKVTDGQKKAPRVRGRIEVDRRGSGSGAISPPLPCWPGCPV